MLGRGSPGLRGGTSPRAAELSAPRSPQRRGLDRTPIACVQNPQNLIHRASMPILQECSGRGIAFVPFFPLGSRLRPGQPGAEQCAPAQHRPTAGPRPGPDCACLAAGPGAQRLADSRHVIQGHLEQNVAAAGIKLDEHTQAELVAATQ
jgi:pyridoxine 4-dehydrogenase